MKNQALLLILVTILITSCGPSYDNNQAAGKYYEVRGVKLYTETYGSGKPVLFIHGNSGNMSAFKSNIGYFAKKYKVITVDSRAQGKSTDMRDSLSFEMMADDFAALLDKMNINAAYVVGWSDGGINALELAMRHPEKVIKLASTGANLWPDSTGIMPKDWLEEQTHYNQFKNTVWKTDKEKNDWKIFMLDWNQPHIRLTDLKKISCPALIISGDHDVIPLQHTVQIFQAIPNAYLWVIPDSPHATVMAHSDEFNRKVDEFFSHDFHKW